MQNTNSLQNCTSNSTLTKGRTPFETAQPVRDIGDRKTRDRDQTETKDCRGRDETKTTKKWSEDRSGELQV